MAEGLLGRIGGGIKGILGSPAVAGAAAAGLTGLNPLLGLLAAPAIASNRERRALENQALREQLTAAKRQNAQADRAQAAMEQLSGILNPAPVTADVPLPPAMAAQRAQSERGEVLGLLGQIAPESVAQGILGQVFPQGERAEPADLRMMDALGIPRTPEGFEQFNRMKGDGGIDDLLKRLQADALIREREKETKEAAQAETEAARSIQSRLSRATHLIELTDSLEGTFLEPGSFGIEGRRTLASGGAEVLDLLGFDDRAEQIRQNVANFDKMRKEANAFVNDILADLTGQVSEMRIQAIKSGMANENISPPAIRSIMGQTIDLALSEASAKFSAEELGEFVQIRNRLQRSSDPAWRQASQLEGFDELSPEDQEELVNHLRAQGGGR